GTFTVNVTVSWSGFITPVPSGGARNVNADLPVKFSLTGASASMHDLPARLYVSGATSGPWTPAASQNSANNLFRYDPAAGQYVFNLAGRSLATGTWYLRIDLGDGSMNIMSVVLR